MLTSMLRRVNGWLTTNNTSHRPIRRAGYMPRFESLEDRVTPTVFYSATISGSLLTISKIGSISSGNGELTIVKSSAFQGITVSTTAGFINGSFSSVTTPVAITSIIINQGFGNDSLTFDGKAANGPINLSGGLTITGTGGNKDITADQLNLIGKGALRITLNGNGVSNVDFTDVNVAGAAAISHTGTGDTFFTLDTSTTNTTALNRWGSLSITNGVGADTNLISDTQFTGSLAINNGKGGVANISQFGGSRNVLTAKNYKTLLSVGGNVSILTTTGQTDTQVFDYNVYGNLKIGAGAGVAGQGVANYVGIQNKQTVANSGIPVLGSVTVTGNAVAGPGLSIDIGTDNTGADFFLRILGAMNISTATTSKAATGAATIDLNDLTVGGTTAITLGANSSGNVVNVQGDAVTASYAGMVITSQATSNSFTSAYNIQTVKGTTNFSGGLAFKLTKGTDAITLGAGTDGFVNTIGAVSLSSTGGAKTFTTRNAVLGGLNFAGTGVGTRTSLFTDTNVTGAAVVSHLATGDTSFTINTSATNANLVNYWNSLSITNGTGADVNFIRDTMFAGSLSINNGRGVTGNTSQYGGSRTVISAERYKTLLYVGGSVAIATSTGQSDTRIFDYNVRGNLAINSGAGVLNQAIASFIGVENDQTIANSGIPIIGGSLNLTGTPVRTLPTGLIVNVGTDGTSKNLPLIVQTNLTVTATGSGSAKITLNDLNVENGTTTINLASTTFDNTVTVQGSTVTSVFWNFAINSFALGNNFYNLQNQAGRTQFTGTVNVRLGAGNDIVNVAANSGSPLGVPNSFVEFYSTSFFDGGLGSNLLFAGVTGTRVFFDLTPVVIRF